MSFWGLNTLKGLQRFRAFYWLKFIYMKSSWLDEVKAISMPPQYVRYIAYSETAFWHKHLSGIASFQIILSTLVMTCKDIFTQDEIHW